MPVITGKKKSKKSKKSVESKKETPPPTPLAVKPILGVDLKGELLDVPLEVVIDPAGPADRLPRPGDDAAIEQLARSMAECGQLQPVMLERLVDGRFCRVFGRRRIAAVRRLGWATIRASVVPPLPDDVRRTIVAIENVQRQDLTPAEETLAVDELMLLQAIPAARQLGKPLLEGCGAWSGRTASAATSFEEAGAEAKAALSHDALLDHRVRGIAAELVAAMLGKPASWVRDRLYIGRLSDKSKRLVLEGKLPLAHAREISKVADEKQRDELAKDYAAGGSDSIGDTEAGPLEDLQEEVRKSVFALNVVPWQRGVAFAGKRPCDGCPHNSATNPGLFEGGGAVSTHMVGGRGTYDSADATSAKVAEAGICTLPACYADKLRAAKAAIGATAKRIVDGGKKPADAKVPAYVSPAALEAKVRQRRSLEKPKAPKKAGPTPQQKAAEAKRDAKDKVEEEMRDRVEKVEPLVAKALAKIPGAWSLFKVFMDNELVRKTQGSDRAKAMASPGLKRLLDLLAKPSLEAFAEMEKGCGRKYDLFISWYDGTSGLAEAVAEALGIDVEAEIGPRPKVEDFLPKTDGAAAPAKKGKASGRKKSKKSPEFDDRIEPGRERAGIDDVEEDET